MVCGSNFPDFEVACWYGFSFLLYNILCCWDNIVLAGSFWYRSMHLSSLNFFFSFVNFWLSLFYYYFLERILIRKFDAVFLIWPLNKPSIVKDTICFFTIYWGNKLLLIFTWIHHYYYFICLYHPQLIISALIKKFTTKIVYVNLSQQ